jgi:alkyl hydroperoxide reductase subunit F
VAVIGGGNSGVEAAIDLAGIVSHVTLLEFDSKLRADAVLQAKLAACPTSPSSPARRPPRSPATARR